MQATRQQILQELWDQHSMSVGDFAGRLGLSPMTIRHHLIILERDGLVQSAPETRNGAVGRPRLAYSLTPTGAESFPSNLVQLTGAILLQIRQMMDRPTVNALIEGVTRHLASSFTPPADGSVERLLDQTVDFLNNMGYGASWALVGEGYRIQMGNCPYRWVAQRHADTCLIDQTLLARLSGATVERVEMGSQESSGTRNAVCEYRLIWPANAVQTTGDRVHSAGLSRITLTAGD